MTICLRRWKDKVESDYSLDKVKGCEIQMKECISVGYLWTHCLVFILSKRVYVVTPLTMKIFHISFHLITYANIKYQYKHSFFVQLHLIAIHEITIDNTSINKCPFKETITKKQPIENAKLYSCYTMTHHKKMLMNLICSKLS